MAQNQKTVESTMEIERLATQLAKDPHSKVFMPLAEEYGKVGMWQEAAAVLEDGLKFYPGFITAMVALGRAYDQMGQVTKAKTILEESVKLSPENLRAHRTLIKIYSSQGLNESALQCCAVILAVNPRDEEALSMQTALGGPQKRMKEPKQAKPEAPVRRNLSAEKAAALPAPVEFQVSATETATPPENMPVSTPTEPEITSTDPLIVAGDLMETAIHRHDQTAEQPKVPKPNPQTAESVAIAPPSPRAGVVAQLEARLRTIRSRRRDRDATNEPHSKTS